MSNQEELEATINDLREKLESTKKMQGGSDRAFQEAARKAAELEAKLAKMSAYAGGEAAILSRLDRIEKAYADKQAQLEIQFYAKEKALVSGIDFGLLDGFTFKDRAAVDAKVAALSQYIEDVSKDRINEKLKGGRQPMAGPSAKESNPFLEIVRR